MKSYKYFLSIALILSSTLSSEKDIDLSKSLEANNSSNKEYRIDLIVFKNEKISEDSKKEIFDVPSKIQFANNLLKISQEPSLLISNKSIIESIKIKEPSINNLKPVLSKSEKGEFSQNKFLPYNYFENIRPSKTPNSDIATRIKRSKEYTIFYEASWYQPILNKNLSIPIYINKSINTEIIYGQIDIYRERYMHSEIDLRFSKYGKSLTSYVVNVNEYNDIGSLPKDRIIPKAYNFIKFLGSEIYDFSSKVFLNRDYENESKKLDNKEIIENVLDIYQIVEERKMMNGELHYFDHPYFGVLIKIEEWKKEE